MQISINRQPIETTLENEKELGEVIQQLVNWVVDIQQYIYQIEVDGTYYSPHQQELWSPIKIAEVGYLNLETFSPTDLKESLQLLGEVSIMMQSERGKEAMQSIELFSVLLTRFLHILPQLPSEIREKVGAHIKELNSTLTQLVEGFEAQDTVLIADIVEYEVVPRVERLIAAMPSRNAPMNSATNS